jgi:hypothetical protein
MRRTINTDVPQPDSSESIADSQSLLPSAQQIQQDHLSDNNEDQEEEDSDDTASLSQASINSEY